MPIRQLSIFLENKSGRLAEVTTILGEAGIDMRALVISDTTDFGVLRLLVNKPEEALKALKENEFTVSLTDVVVIATPDSPGGLSKVLQLLEKSGIDIEYMYAFIGRKSGEAPAVFRVEDVVKTVEVLKNNNIRVITEEEL